MIKVDTASITDLSRSIARDDSRAQEAGRQEAVDTGRQAVTESGNVSPLNRAEAAQTEASSEAAFENAVENISNYVQNITRDLEFSVDEDLGKTVVTVLNTETQEVIRQIPSEEMVELAKRLDRKEPGDLITGVLVSKEI